MCNRRVTNHRNKAFNTMHMINKIKLTNKRVQNYVRFNAFSN